MSDHHRRTRRQHYADESNRDSWEFAKAFRQARYFIKTGQLGRGQALIQPFRGIRRGSMEQIQNEENT